MLTADGARSNPDAAKPAFTHSLTSCPVPQPGTDYDWDAPTKLTAPGINGSTVPLPYGLNPDQVPLAGSYTTGAQQQSRLTSAWYQLPKADDGHPLVAVTAAGTITGNSVLHHHTEGQTVALEYGR